MPKAAKRLTEMRPPKRVKNDSYAVMNDLEERHRQPTRIASNDWGKAIGGGDAYPERPNEFPVRINKPNRRRDTRIRLKSAYADQWNQANGLNLGEPKFDDGDLEAFADLERQRQVVSFESWLASYLNMSDPATAKLVDEIMPEYWEKRQGAIENQAELQKNLALIRLRGPQSKKDFMILYMLSTNQIQLPKGAVFDPASWSYNNSDFTRGMLNPRRYMPSEVGVDKTDPILSIMQRQAAGGDARPAGIKGLDAKLPSIGGLDSTNFRKLDSMPAFA